MKRTDMSRGILLTMQLYAILEGGGWVPYFVLRYLPSPERDMGFPSDWSTPPIRGTCGRDMGPVTGILPEGTWDQWLGYPKQMGHGTSDWGICWNNRHIPVKTLAP